MNASQTSFFGIDPSLVKTGLARITSDGRLVTKLLKTPTRGFERLQFYRDGLKAFLEEALLLGPVKGVCIEGPSLGSVNRADDLGQLRGALGLCARDYCASILVVPPTSLKKFATGNGGAKKEAMIKAAEVKWGVVLTDDEADAAWMAFLAQAMNSEVALTRAQMSVKFGINNPRVKTRISSRNRDNI